ncbi:MAG: translation initiation factor [Thiovulaceae bacterium]|nr:translation initiation factor [Sulfurimonadaceae bacterium]
MSRGKKLDLQIGTELGENDWAVVSEKRESSTAQEKEADKHQLVFHKEKRRGKAVTLVGPFSIEKDLLKALLKSLKKGLACGGTINEDFLEFQGDVEMKIRAFLEGMGYRFKRK